MKLKPNDVTIKKISEEGNVGVYSFKPLPKGFGHTLGNTLRRVLLTSLDGAAVTQVKIEGASHEFTTVKGIKEDVVELSLNFKEIRAKTHSENPVVLRISKKGPGKVTAGDIEKSSEVEILNPKLVLATLSDSKSVFDAELVFEKGVGYLPTEDRETSKIGVILLDAMFSPVLSATYEVEQTRMGRDIDLDNLIITVETDGSLSPEDAITQSATLLRGFFARFADGEDEEVVVEEVEEEVAPVVAVEDVAVEELPLPTRTINALKKHGITSLKDLATKTPEDLADVKNLGDKSVQEIEKLLKKEGLTE